MKQTTFNKPVCIIHMNYVEIRQENSCLNFSVKSFSKENLLYRCRRMKQKFFLTP